METILIFSPTLATLYSPYLTKSEYSFLGLDSKDFINFLNKAESISISSLSCKKFSMLKNLERWFSTKINIKLSFSHNHSLFLKPKKFEKIFNFTSNSEKNSSPTENFSNKINEFLRRKFLIKLSANWEYFQMIVILMPLRFIHLLMNPLSLREYLLSLLIWKDQSKKKQI